MHHDTIDLPISGLDVEQETTDRIIAARRAGNLRKQIGNLLAGGLLSCRRCGRATGGRTAGGGASGSPAGGARR